MTQILKSLEALSIGYSVFEKDQVLTHDQLNSISGYFEDQSRLTRITLVGVGVVCGLRVALQGNTVTVARGVGVTTDGDLLSFAENTVFDKFRAYDKTNPAYGPFYLNGDVSNEMISVYELVRAAEAADGRTALLSRFATQAGKPLANMVAVLFMESYVTDRDLCSGTDCDNLGQDCNNRVRLLLVDKTAAGALHYVAATPHRAFGALNEIVADRPLFSAATNAPGLLAQTYRTVCTTIHNRLLAELPKLYQHGASFLADLFPADPAVAWNSRLAALKATFATQTYGIQYYYDFLRDVVETCNDFRALLFGDRTWCCPDPAAFPKHLLLGPLAPGVDADELRTAFYPSPATSRTKAQLCHARFLLRKLNTLILTFQVPAAQGAAIRITPSLGQDQPLEERAIPFYYQVNATEPIHANWNHALARRGMAAANYSYNAAAYGAQGSAANPLVAQIGRFPFFRIEGHVGQPVQTVIDALEKEIAAKNLPIAVRAVMLGPDRTRVVKRPGIRYTDLHRFHYLLRQDVSHQLQEVVNFSQNFKQKVNTAVRNNVVVDAPDDATGVTLKNVAKDQNATVARNASRVRAKLNRSYSSYKADPTWKQNVAPAMQAAGQFKSRLSEVVKTEFATPFDSLISNTHIQWIDWLDDIIKARDDHEDEKLLFAAFIAQHPGIEHCAGVLRGGTFVLVHDASQTVVADFMLPYYCCDIVEEEPAQPPLKKPGLRPGWIVGNGITVLPSRTKFVKDRLDTFKTDQLEGMVKNRLDSFKLEHVDSLKERLDWVWNQKFDAQQKEYFNAVKETVNLMGNALAGKQQMAVEAGGMMAGGAYRDEGLGQRVADAKQKQAVVTYYRTKASQPDVPADKRQVYQERAQEAEAELAGAVAETAKYVAASKQEVALGSESQAALMEVSAGMQAITSPQAVEMVAASFTEVKKTSDSANLNMMMDAMLALKR